MSYLKNLIKEACSVEWVLVYIMFAGVATFTYYKDTNKVYVDLTDIEVCVSETTKD